MRRGAAHTQTGLFRTADLGRVLIDFASPMGKILPLTPTESETNRTTNCAGVAKWQTRRT